jgi:hypothetical protein
MNQAYRDILVARIQGAVAAANSMAHVQHSGRKGRLREILIRQLFRPLLPMDIGVGTGEIITVVTGEPASKEQGVVIFDRRILPPLVLGSSIGLFPLESVLFTIEVKSRLTADELRKAHESAPHLGRLRALSGHFDDEGRNIRDKFLPPIATVFALASDLSDDVPQEGQRYDRIRESTTSDPPIRMLCVVGRGTWIWATSRRNPPSKVWRHLPATKDFEEVLGFMALFFQHYPVIAASRGAPLIVAYFADVPLNIPGPPTP